LAGLLFGPAEHAVYLNVETAKPVSVDWLSRIPRRKMMTLLRTTCLSAASVLLAFGLTAAQAQDNGGGEAGGPPAAEMDRGAPPAEGGASDAMPAPRNEAGAEAAKPDEKGGKAKGHAKEMKDEKSGATAKEEKAGTQMKDDRAGADKKDEKAGSAMKDEKAGATAETKDRMGKDDGKDKSEATAETKDRMDNEGKDPTADTKTGAEDADGKTAKVDPEQISKAKTYFRQNRPRVKAIDRSEISVSIGFALPGTIVLYDLPPDVIVVRGGCGIKYFLWGDDVVLVDSCTRRVVDIVALG
jgi:hypothetical protein